VSRQEAGALIRSFRRCVDICYKCKVGGSLFYTLTGATSKLKKKKKKKKTPSNPYFIYNATL